MFILFVITLISTYIVIFNGVFSLISVLLSSTMTLSVLYGYNGGCDGLLVALGIKFGVCSLGGYSLNVYSLLV